ncbi:MAG TPA: hypothetical protein PLG02_07305 [Methylotenera sp.]|nr:hypothetical protein [Methylotenera sp.]
MPAEITLFMLKQRLKHLQTRGFTFSEGNRFSQPNLVFFRAFTSATFFDALRAFIYKARRA